MIDPAHTTGRSSSPQPNPSEMGSAARASLVNRTHRIVRAEARIQTDRRNRLRSLWIPLAVCAALLIIMATGAWTTLAQYELTPTEIPDASEQMFVFLLWFLPVTGAILAMVWFKRAHLSSGNESPQ